MHMSDLFTEWTSLGDLAKCGKFRTFSINVYTKKAIGSIVSADCICLIEIWIKEDEIMIYGLDSYKLSYLISVRHRTELVEQPCL